MNRVFTWHDRGSWPREWPRFCCEPDSAQLVPYGESLGREYSAIRCFHGARPTDVESYYATGLRLTDSGDLIRYAKRVFNLPIFSSVSEDEVDRAIEEVGCSDHGKVYVTLDDRNLVENAGHYLIYGSEFIMAVAAHFPASRAVGCQQLLKTIGTPTIYEVEVPISHISPSELNHLALEIGNEEPGTESPRIIDFTFVLKEALSKELIVGHSHPPRVRDWHNGGIDYVWENMA